MVCLWQGTSTGNVRYFFPAAALITLAFLKGPLEQSTRVGSIPVIAFFSFCLVLAPNLSDDFHRYLWEGHVQNHGFSPYQHSPQSLYSQLDHPSEGAINHDHLPAIYPPLAQYLFRLSDLVSQRFWGWKLILILWCAAWALLLKRSGYRWLAMIPIVLIEGWWNGHLDLAGLLPCLVLVDSVESGRPWRSGLAMGSLIALKTMPIIWLPFAFFTLNPEHRLKFLGASGGIVLFCYAPFLAQGPALFTSFLTFSKTWAFNNLGYLGLSALFGNQGTRVLMAVTFLLSYIVIFFRVSGFRRKCLMVWIFLIVCSPTFYPWYLFWLVPMIPIHRFQVFNLTYLASFLSYWVLVDFRATGVWKEQWFWLIPEWLILGFCFVMLMRLPSYEESEPNNENASEQEPVNP